MTRFPSLFEQVLLDRAEQQAVEVTHADIMRRERVYCGCGCGHWWREGCDGRGDHRKYLNRLHKQRVWSRRRRRFPNTPLSV